MPAARCYTGAKGTLRIKQRERRERPVNLSCSGSPRGTKGEGNNGADESSARAKRSKENVCRIRGTGGGIYKGIE